MVTVAPLAFHPTILVVDDDQQIRAMTAEVLRNEGYRAVVAATYAEAHNRLGYLRFALVLADTADHRAPAAERWGGPGAPARRRRWHPGRHLLRTPRRHLRRLRGARLRGVPAEALRPR